MMFVFYALFMCECNFIVIFFMFWSVIFEPNMVSFGTTKSPVQALLKTNQYWLQHLCLPWQLHELGFLPVLFHNTFFKSLTHYIVTENIRILYWCPCCILKKWWSQKCPLFFSFNSHQQLWKWISKTSGLYLILRTSFSKSSEW